MPYEPCDNCWCTPASRQFRNGRATRHFLCNDCNDNLVPTHYQCNTCGHLHETFDSARACHNNSIIIAPAGKDHARG